MTVESGGIVRYEYQLYSDLTLAGSVASTTQFQGITFLKGASLRLYLTTVLNGVTLNLESGAQLASSYIASGGLEVLHPGALETEAIVLSGGDLALADLIIASGTTSSAFLS